MPSTRPKHSREQLEVADESPRKRTKLLMDDDSSDNSDSSDRSGGVALELKLAPVIENGFKVNEEYARRFEHNQRRAEIHRCIFATQIICACPFTDNFTVEEKYGTDINHEPSKANGFFDEDRSDSSTDEEEDDEGILASGLLDDQVNATLEAIRRKDPRVYDEKVTFYSKSDDDEESDYEIVPKRKEKPMYLKDYHRENLLTGAIMVDEGDAPPHTYAEEQDRLRDAVIREMHEAAPKLELESSSACSDGGDDGNDFLVRKQPPLHDATSGVAKAKLDSVVDVENADQDPETFLSNFMSARAWVPAAQSRFQPFESDDEEDDRRAEAFEEAYNLRFENPQGSNEKLISIARDTAAKYSVRKEVTNSRKRAREAEQAKKEALKQDREQEKARLRTLRIEEATEKVNKIREAAGLRGRALAVDDWSDFLTQDWNDERWEIEMNNRFGDQYYADQEHENRDGENSKQKQKLKPKKPKWKDDIDITDLVPQFDTDEANNVKFSLSDDSDDEANNAGIDLKNIEAEQVGKKLKSIKRKREDIKKEYRQERRKVEQLVDEKLHIDLALSNSGNRHSKSGPFRYRETSPLAFGLTAHDILMASDGQLNQYAGLKKMAAFRDVDKKKKDKKRLGKKARLRQWRKETFGNEHGPRKSLQELLREQLSANDRVDTQSVEITKVNRDKDKGQKRKRSRKNKEAVSTS